MLKLLFGLILFLSTLSAFSQQHSMAVGLFTGITVPYTFDQGINSDSRYKEKYTAKFAPIGFAYSMDYEGFGFITTPGLITLGQNYHIVNTVGGQNGKRSINLRYVNVPIALKIHIIDLSFFKVSGMVSFGGAFLLDASDKISHIDAKLRFPFETYPLLTTSFPDYSIEYDGVVVPVIDDLTVIKKSEYNSVQLFAGAGFRADWDVSNHWRVSFDFRVNYGLTESRTAEYVSRVKAYETLYDTPGKRNETFAQLSIGVARFLDFDKNDKERAKNLKGNSKKFTPKKQSKRKPRGK